MTAPNAVEAAVVDTGKRARDGRVCYRIEFYAPEQLIVDLERNAQAMMYTTDQYISAAIGRASWDDAQRRWQQYMDRS